MHRLFVAIRPPLHIRESLLAIMGGVEAARWQDDDLIHITLRFIGEVDPRQAEEIALMLERIDAPALDLRITGVGSFEKKGRVHTLWAGVEPQTPLIALHRKIERMLTDMGLAQTALDFVPHVTLARFSAQGGQVGDFLRTHGDLSLPAFTADHFSLYESKLGADGPSYQEVARYPMGLNGNIPR